MAYGSSLTALADPTRREIFEQLRSRPRAVGELAADLPVSRPAVSQHLRVLKDAGLVADEQVGARRVYRVDPEGLLELRAWVDGFWKDALASFRHAAEQETSTNRRKR
jgi:DNA-binding transcriptional ArsR family regulator